MCLFIQWITLHRRRKKKYVTIQKSTRPIRRMTLFNQIKIYVEQFSCAINHIFIKCCAFVSMRLHLVHKRFSRFAQCVQCSNAFVSACFCFSCAIICSKLVYFSVSCQCLERKWHLSSILSIFEQYSRTKLMQCCCLLCWLLGLQFSAPAINRSSEDGV